MRALRVQPGRSGSLRVEDVPDPAPGSGELLVRGLAVGVCGTDKEIVRGDYGWAPPGQDRLVLGHESLVASSRCLRQAPSAAVTSSSVWCAVRTRSRAERALSASGTCAATVATPSAASRSCPASAASGGPCPSGMPCAWTQAWPRWGPDRADQRGGQGVG